MNERKANEWRVLGAIVALVLGAALTAAPVGAQEVAYVQVDGSANSDRVVAIDTASNQVVDVFEFPQGAFGIAISPDGSRLYVSNAFASQISVLEPITGIVTGVLPTAAPVPMLAISPDGGLLYAGVRDDTVIVIDTSSLAVLATIAVGDDPEYVALSDDGTRLVTLNWKSGDVTVIDTATKTVIATLPAGRYPAAAAFEPGSLVVWVSKWLSNAGEGTLELLDTGAGVAISSISLDTDWPTGIDFLPDGSRAYVAHGLFPEVSVLDVASQTRVTTIPVGDQPLFLKVNLDGSRVFVTNGVSGDVSVIDTATDTVMATVLLGGRPVDVWVGVSPPPSGAVEAVAETVDALLVQGAISAGQASALSAKLDSAADKLASGADQAAKGKLEAFVLQVEAMLRSNRISEKDGRALIDAAQAILDSLV